jgi:hypothetical protein
MKRCQQVSTFILALMSMAKAFSIITEHKTSDVSSTTRRNILNTMVSTILPTLGSVFLVQPETAVAKDELFKPNPLTNPILEQIRILEQAEADNIRYGGELAPGSPKGRETYANLLVPILEIQSDFVEVEQLLFNIQAGQSTVLQKQGEQSTAMKLEAANKILSRPQFEKLRFKKIFNAFADNIYYSDPDRANAYLGGGAVPRNEQSIAYLLRNEVLTNLENLQAEVVYLIKEEKAGNALETEDLVTYIKLCTGGMEKYLELVPPNEIKLAKEIVAKKKI